MNSVIKYLGIDFGEKRVGLAISDDSGKMAFPHSVLPNNENLIQEILKIIEKEKLLGVVVGESKNFKGENNKIMVKIEEFIKKLEGETKLKIIMEPEFLTSHQAERITGKNDMIDASAAAIILQSFLDRLN